jgi:pyruvate-formate lyase-activating enzyme
MARATDWSFLCKVATSIACLAITHIRFVTVTIAVIVCQPAHRKHCASMLTSKSNG